MMTMTMTMVPMIYTTDNNDDNDLHDNNEDNDDDHTQCQGSQAASFPTRCRRCSPRYSQFQPGIMTVMII